ncbi:hypothetical protein FRC09_008466 [Ceratobasidium sp. 395]|nr:hypothetical protein FRC09_008466 [Ceratobasidium sp. 395]
MVQGSTHSQKAQAAQVADTVFSHTRAPFVPPPDPPTERLPVPESAAARRRHVAKEKQAAANSAANSKGPTNKAGQSQGAQLKSKQPNSGPSNVESPPIGSSPTAQSARPQPPAMPEQTSNVPTVVSPEPGHEFASLIPAPNNPATSTPRQPNHPISFATPVLVFVQQPNWQAQHADDNLDSQFPPFIPQHSALCDATFNPQLSDLSPQRTSFVQSPLRNFGHNRTEFADPGPGFRAAEPGPTASLV